jgi:L-2,4-diaminobutyric acid acetyltransferase
VALRQPQAADGTAIHDLIARCPPLDANSLYCNLLQCSHFAETCVLVEIDRKIAGWVSGYIRPDAPDCLFIWQVAVAREARGHGLGKRMIREILRREACHGVTRIESTITETNKASWSLFQAIADDLGAPLQRRKGFDTHTHFAGRNPTELLVDIGPLPGSPQGL